MRVLFIGAGNMAQAIIGGVIKKKVLSPGQISIFEIDKEKAINVQNEFNINAQQDIGPSLADHDIIVLAVKPQVFYSFDEDNMMKGLKEIVNKDKLIVSIMAGVKISKVKGFFGNDVPVIRVMPNTPALVGLSMSVLSYSSDVSKDKLNMVKNIFSSVGEIEVMEEKYLDAVTGLSGSGPAYVFTFIEAMTEGGVLCGLSKESAEKLAIQTVIGASNMINGTTSVEELRRRVASPGGTTIEGLKVLDREGFKIAVTNAIKAATERSIELSS